MVNFMRAALNEHRKYNGLEPVSATDFLKLMREKRAIVELDNKLASRSVNEGFSGGEKKRNEIFQDIFDDDSLVSTETTTANDVEDWDSIEHINLIDAVEKEFGMKFKMQEVSGMKNVGEMVQIIAERCAEPKPKKRGLFRR